MVIYEEDIIGQCCYVSLDFLRRGISILFVQYGEHSIKRLDSLWL